MIILITKTVYFPKMSITNLQNPFKLAIYGFHGKFLYHVKYLRMNISKYFYERKFMYRTYMLRISIVQNSVLQM